MFRFHVDDGGPLYIKNYTDGAWENSLMCVGASYTALYHDNSLKLETTSGGAKVTGFLNLTAGLHVPDGSSSGDSSIVIGTHNDFRLFHSSAHSHIYHNGTGHLFIESIDANITLRAGNNAGGTHDSIVCLNNEGVRLYYDSGSYSDPKLETVSYGVRVGGHVRPLTSRDDTDDLGGTGQRWDDVYATNTTITTSDRNEKEDIVATDLGLEFVNKLTPVSFKRKGKTRTHYGLVAQDVETVITDLGKTTTEFAPLIIGTLEDGTKQYGLRYTELMSPLIKAVQELSAEVETLKTKVAALEAK